MFVTLDKKMGLCDSVYLGIGSNAGDRISNLKKALKIISCSRDVKVLKVSGFYQTSPVGPRQRDFINAVLKAGCALSPLKLLKFVKNIERQLGRAKSGIKWGPRKIDIDILFFGKRKINTKTLIIPHPEIANRLFVLEPLAGIAPGFRHPVMKKTVSVLIKKLLLTSKEQKVRILRNER